eukprot:COSAG02_NODE_9304_length_2261_cov_1.469935_2_plen_85_part_00
MPGPGTPSRWSQMSEPPERAEGVKLSDIQASVPCVHSLDLLACRACLSPRVCAMRVVHRHCWLATHAFLRHAGFLWRPLHARAA